MRLFFNSKWHYGTYNYLFYYNLISHISIKISSRVWFVIFDELSEQFIKEFRLWRYHEFDPDFFQWLFLFKDYNIFQESSKFSRNLLKTFLLISLGLFSTFSVKAFSHLFSFLNLKKFSNDFFFVSNIHQGMFPGKCQTFFRYFWEKLEKIREEYLKEILQHYMM